MNYFYTILIVVLAFGLAPLIRWLIAYRHFSKGRQNCVSGLRFPHDGTWLVAGGGTLTGNHHLAVPAQVWAYDWCKLGEDGDLRQNISEELSDYYTFGTDIYAVDDGEVLTAVNGFPDNPIGQMDMSMVYGNTVMIKHAEGVVSVYAHLKLDSLSVKMGDRVTRGTVLGQCGNSGCSTMPHLHFHLQTGEGFDVGTPLQPVFDKLTVKRDNQPIARDAVVLSKGDIVSTN